MKLIVDFYNKYVYLLCYAFNFIDAVVQKNPKSGSEMSALKSPIFIML